MMAARHSIPSTEAKSTSPTPCSMCARRSESAWLHAGTVVTIGDGDDTGDAEGPAGAATDEDPASGVGVTTADDVGDGDTEESGDEEGDGEGVGSSDEERRGEPKDRSPL